jgi:hypothetical protein
MQKEPLMGADGRSYKAKKGPDELGALHAAFGHHQTVKQSREEQVTAAPLELARLSVHQRFLLTGSG